MRGGPESQVTAHTRPSRDLFRLPGATANDKALFTQYRKELVALPPGRTFTSASTPASRRDNLPHSSPGARSPFLCHRSKGLNMAVAYPCDA